MIIRAFFLVIVQTIFVAPLLSAAVSSAPLFRDGAVLQHGKPIPVWGMAVPGEEITVTFAGQTVSTETDPQGRWSVTLAALEPNAEPAEMLIAGNETVRITDILVGEVWLASGQSNMVWTVAQSHDADLEVLMAQWPLIREFNVSRAATPEPLDQIDGRWVSAQRESVSSFSAVAYAFARDLHQALHIPVGIINSTWGGTVAEAWTDADTLDEEAFAAIRQRGKDLLGRTLAAYEENLAEWRREREAAAIAGDPFTRERPSPPTPHQLRNAPSFLYNGMIHPLVPYGIRGAIWYQGEGNARRYEEYRDLFPALITGWRRVFRQGDFPFYWVQLAEVRAQGPRDTTWAFLREAQSRALHLPGTGQAVILDVGDVHDIHPGDKSTVGRRLARLALNRTYGHGIEDSGPAFAGADFEGETVRVHFSNTAGGIRTTAVTVRGFELAGEDRRFFPATASISGDSVVLISDDVPAPVAIRYAWRNAPEATLSNGAGLPAAPFRTDDWRQD